MTERKLTTEFSNYLKDHPRTQTETYELKMVTGNRFSLKAVKPHQLTGLMTSLNGLGHKIADMPVYAGAKTRFTFKKPFDYVYIKSGAAYVVSIFYKARKYKRAYLIPIRGFILLSQIVSSVSMEEFDKMGIECINLMKI